MTKKKKIAWRAANAQARYDKADDEGEFMHPYQQRRSGPRGGSRVFPQLVQPTHLLPEAVLIFARARGSGGGLLLGWREGGGAVPAQPRPAPSGHGQRRACMHELPLCAEAEWVSAATGQRGHARPRAGGACVHRARVMQLGHAPPCPSLGREDAEEVLPISKKRAKSPSAVAAGRARQAKGREAGEVPQWNPLRRSGPSSGRRAAKIFVRSISGTSFASEGSENRF